MPLLTPSNPDQKRLEKASHRASRITTDQIKSRAARISRKWTVAQRAERQRLGVAKREWLFQFINNFSNTKD